MSEPHLVRTQRLLPLASAPDMGSHASFWSIDERGEMDTVCTLPHRLWVDMGRPAVVTVTVEPGDRLNETMHETIAEIYRDVTPEF